MFWGRGRGAWCGGVGRWEVIWRFFDQWGGVLGVGGWKAEGKREIDGGVCRESGEWRGLRKGEDGIEDGVEDEH